MEEYENKRGRRRPEGKEKENKINVLRQSKNRNVKTRK